MPEHWIGHIGNWTVHLDTLITAWLAMILVLIFSISLVSFIKLRRVPSKFQAFAELVYSFVVDISVGQMGMKEGYKHVPVVGSLFLFILTANLVGQLPWKLYHLPQGEFAAPTNDLNLTVALAVIVVIYYIASGVAKKGLSYFKHYITPPFMLPLNVLEDFTRPFSLALRLFANILAGEILITVLVGLIPLIVPIPMMLFELLIAFIQAFVFAILTSVYLAGATAESH